MNKNKYKVLITASGIGTRLGDITKFTNKALVKVGKKPAVSYIIESYPEDAEFVVTTGYYGDQVKDFLSLVYPKRKITFVDVDNYDKEGSSLGYSMLCAKDQLQCPFIFHASDTIVTNSIIHDKSNWIGGYRGKGSSHYSSFNTFNGRVQKIQDKGAIDPEFLHIGLVGINDFKKFWKHLEGLYKKNPLNNSLGDIHVINEMIENDVDFKVKEFGTWFDTGNVESLHEARKNISDAFHILDKLEEAIFIFEKFVVKFFHKQDMVEQRVKRGKILAKLVPNIEGSAKNFYRYKFVDGELYSEVANPYNFGAFLDWSKKNLWKGNKEVNEKKFKEVCYDFYKNKTVERINKFLDSRSVKDQKTFINEEEVPSIKEILKRVDFDWLCSGKQMNFHGDFILDNIIKTKKGYCLLDWRQNFGGLLKAGDVYYDLAKLNHNLTINHGIINDNLFSIKINNNNIWCDVLRKENLIQCQKILFEFLRKNKYDEKKVKILTALIWLNMSPLHHHPFDLFLFYFGKLNLWREIKK